MPKKDLFAHVASRWSPSSRNTTTQLGASTLFNIQIKRQYLGTSFCSYWYMQSKRSAQFYKTLEFCVIDAQHTVLCLLSLSTPPSPCRSSSPPLVAQKHYKTLSKKKEGGPTSARFSVSRSCTTEATLKLVESNCSVLPTRGNVTREFRVASNEFEYTLRLIFSYERKTSKKGVRFPMMKSIAKGQKEFGSIKNQHFDVKDDACIESGQHTMIISITATALCI